jgi:hypothetical protein
MVKPLRIFNSWGLLVICILILGLGYDILIAVEIAKRVVYDEQHKKPQGAGELLGLFWFLTWLNTAIGHCGH